MIGSNGLSELISTTGEEQWSECTEVNDRRGNNGLSGLKSTT